MLYLKIMNTPTSLPIDNATANFTKALEAKKLSPATILAYITDIKQLNQFPFTQGLTQLGQITFQHLELYQKSLVKKGYLAVSVARKLNAIRAFFEFCQKERFLLQNPASSLASPKFEKETPRILSRMEYRALRDSCRSNPRTAALIEIFLQTGLKVNEVAKLTPQDIKKDRLVIRNKNSREIPLTNACKKAIDRYLKVRPDAKVTNLFVTKNGTPLLVRNMSTILMRCFSAAEIKDASLNSLRHTWIYTQLVGGMPLQLVSQLAGHKRINTAARYLTLIEKKQLPTRNRLIEL